MNNEEKIKQAAEILSKAKNIVGFTGAGTSAESGIPPFRGEGGIWNQYDPNSLDIDFYYRHTKESWKIIREVFYEFHGNMSRFVCTKCGHKVDAKSMKLTEEPPRCTQCGGLMKPDFIFFGEGIPEDAYYGSVRAAENCDAFVIIGTSGQVSPANMIPGIAKRNGAKIIEINMEPSTYTNYITDIYLEGKSGEILPAIDALMTR